MSSLQRAAAQAWHCLLQAEARLPVDPLALLERLPRVRLLPSRQGIELARRLMAGRDPGAAALLEGLDGFTLRCADATGRPGLLVFYRTDSAPARRRFTLAHELGHIALGHIGLDSPPQMCVEDATAEAEANCFAGELLVPSPLLCRAGLDAETIARRCGVSREAAARALRRPPRPCDPALAERLCAMLLRGGRL